MLRPLKVITSSGWSESITPLQPPSHFIVCGKWGEGGVKVMKTMTWNHNNLITRKQTDCRCCDQQLPWTSLGRHPAICLPKASRGWWVCCVTRPLANLWENLLQMNASGRRVIWHILIWRRESVQSLPILAQQAPHWCPCSHLPQQSLHRRGGLGWQCLGFILGTRLLFIPTHFR